MTIAHRLESGSTKFSSVGEAERLAARRLPSWLFDGIAMGNGNRMTARENVNVFDSVAFTPRAAAACNQPDISSTVLGEQVRMPVLAAPTGYTRMIHPEGDRAVVKATAAAGTIDVVAWDSGRSLEDVAAAAPSGARLWQQMYWVRGREGATELMQRAADSGYEALVVTIDLSVSPRTEVVLAPRRRSLPLPEFGLDLIGRYGPGAVRHPRWLARFLLDRTLFEIYKPRISSGTPSDCLCPTYDELRWVREQWKGPLVLKGILSSEDASRAVDLGADAIVVSNHGGKCLDTLPATLRVLPAIVDAVGDRLEVYLDSGIRCGSDVVKALALGARAVLVGQAYLFGLALAGGDGVMRVLEIFSEEIQRTMSLIGCEQISELCPSSVVLPGSWTLHSGRTDERMTERRVTR